MSANCGVCDHQCSDLEGVKCAGKCGRVFHAKCIKDDVDGVKTRSQRDWRCKDCRNTSSTQQVGVSSVTSQATTTEFLRGMLEEMRSEISSQLKGFRKEFVELSDSVKFISDKIDESNKLMKQMGEEFTVLKKENEDLRTANAGLTRQVSTLKDKIATMEQYSRKDNLEISGLPVTPNEDIMTLIKDIGDSVGVDISEGDISTAHRVPTFHKNRTPSIVVRFVRRSSRDTVLQKYKEKKGGLTARDINQAFPQQRVYINEHLSPENKVFLSDLKAKCKEVGYAYAWFRDGKFFVRRSQGESCRKIMNYEDIKNLKSA